MKKRLSLEAERYLSQIDFHRFKTADLMNRKNIWFVDVEINSMPEEGLSAGKYTDFVFPNKEEAQLFLSEVFAKNYTENNMVVTGIGIPILHSDSFYSV